MTAYCPECLVVQVRHNARDGRCSACRPVRRHAIPYRPNPGLGELISNHRRSNRDDTA